MFLNYTCGRKKDNKEKIEYANKKYNEKMQLLHSYKVVFPKLSEEFINISGKSFCTEYPEEFKKYFTYDEFFKTGG